MREEIFIEKQIIYQMKYQELKRRKLINGENIHVAKVKITDKTGEEALGKPIGTYITIDVKNLKIATEDDIEQAALAVQEELKAMIGNLVQKQEDILVVGLGNNKVTPDSLRTKSN